MKTMITPFSNGTEAMDWYCNNCERCVKAYFPNEGKDYPTDKTMKEYIRIGKECRMKYDIDMGFITGEIPLDTAKKIGMNKIGQLKDCMMFSDNEDDGYRPPKKPKPDNTPPNQLLMFSEFDEIINMKQFKETENIKNL